MKARLRGRTRTSSAALTRNVSASRPNAAAGLTPSTSAVARTGPANSARLFVVDMTALASWMPSSGTVCGSRAVAAGRKNASAVPNSIPMTTMCQMRTAPVTMRIASSACSTKRTRSVATTTR